MLYISHRLLTGTFSLSRGIAYTRNYNCKLITTWISTVTVRAYAVMPHGSQRTGRCTPSSFRICSERLKKTLSTRVLWSLGDYREWTWRPFIQTVIAKPSLLFIKRCTQRLQPHLVTARIGMCRTRTTPSSSTIIAFGDLHLIG